MSRQYDVYIHQLLEPTDKLISGNHKRIAPVTVVYDNIPQEKRSVEQIEKGEDEFLKEHSI